MAHAEHALEARLVEEVDQVLRIALQAGVPAGVPSRQSRAATGMVVAEGACPGFQRRRHKAPDGLLGAKPVQKDHGRLALAALRPVMS